MKRNIYLLAGITLFMLASCSDDDASSTHNSGSVANVVNIAAGGTWHIASYIDDGTDETNHFTGYTFTFGSGNVLTAINGTNTYTGTWSVTNSDSNNDDGPGTDIDFNIAFASPAVFENLSDGWHVQERTATRIELVDVSGGNGGTDYLTFEKN